MKWQDQWLKWLAKREGKTLKPARTPHPRVGANIHPAILVMLKLAERKRG